MDEMRIVTCSAPINIAVIKYCERAACSGRAGLGGVNLIIRARVQFVHM